MKKTNFIIAFATILVLGSCKKYLSVEPMVQTDIKTVDQLQALVDNVNTGPAFAINTDNYFANSSDDTEISQALYQGAPGSTFSSTIISAYVFEINGIINQPSDVFWTAE